VVVAADLAEALRREAELEEVSSIERREELCELELMRGRTRRISVQFLWPTSSSDGCV
jgi:hypothetical protein